MEIPMEIPYSPATSDLYRDPTDPAMVGAATDG